MTLSENSRNILLLAALSAAREAGEAILEVYGSDIAVEHKDDNSPLTLADRRSHEIISLRLGNYPYPVLSEEGRNIPYEQRREWEFFWLVDPLDGTKEFIKRSSEFTVNIALIRRDRPVFGVVYVPVQGIFYYGGDGMGACRLKKGGEVKAPEKRFGDEKLERAACGLVEGSERLPIEHPPARPLTVIASRSHMSKETQEFIDNLREERGDVEMVSAGSSLKFCLVAEGRADIYPRFGPTMEWDTAAGQAVVEGAGGSVLDMAGRPLRYNKESLLNPWFIVRGPERGGVKHNP